ncbi:glycogen debranching protein [Streptomyces noursei]|nr:glycogen debranching protein [Streptomyces noursei]
MPGIVPTTQPTHRPVGDRRTAPARPPQPQPVHAALVCVALPSLAVSSPTGQLTGRGLDGCYRDGRRILSRCEVRAAGGEPLVVQGRLTGADRARFTGVIRRAGERGPDPEIRMERLRSADGTEQITFHSSAARPVRLPVEIHLGTDLADLGAVAVGLPAPNSAPPSTDPASAGQARGHATVTATPHRRTPWPPRACSAGNWSCPRRPAHHRAPPRLEYGPAGQPAPAGRVGRIPVPGPRTAPTGPAPAANGPALLVRRPPGVRRPRADALMAGSLDDLHGLLMRDPALPTDVFVAGGFPWRCGLAPAEALWTARMLLPLGTRLAAATLRTLARTQQATPGGDFGRIPGPLRDSGPHAPPGCTGIEATLLFPAVLAEARRWGLPDHETEAAAARRRTLPSVAAHGRRPARRAPRRLPPRPAPDGPYRCETQAHAHRAAILGADLLDACGSPAPRAPRLGGRTAPASARTSGWRTAPAAARPPCSPATAAPSAPRRHRRPSPRHRPARRRNVRPGLLDAARTDQLARLLRAPVMDSGWGLRGLGAKESGYNPFGHRGGAVRVHETAVAVAGLAAAGHEAAAATLTRGILDAAEASATACQRCSRGAAHRRRRPLPHPAACRPAAVAAAGAVQILLALAGLRPDVPAGTVAVRPLGNPPLGAMQLTGLTLAEQPFAVRISRLGMGMVEEAADGLQLGS